MIMRSGNSWNLELLINIYVLTDLVIFLSMLC